MLAKAMAKTDTKAGNSNFIRAHDFLDVEQVGIV